MSHDKALYKSADTFTLLEALMTGSIVASWFPALPLKAEVHLLHFARVVDDAKCIVVTRVCLSVRGRMPTLLHGPGCNLGEWWGCPLVVHYWADLQSVHGLRRYDNIARTRNVSECLYSLCVWFDWLSTCCGFYCTVCYTTNPQLKPLLHVQLIACNYCMQFTACNKLHM